MSYVGTILVLAALGGIATCAWRYRALSGQRAAEAMICARAQRRVRALEAVARAESLAELALLVHMQPALSTMWDVVAQELEQLSDSTRSLCEASRTFAFWRATRTLADALGQLDREVARCRRLSVPDVAPIDDEWASAAARLQETSVELAIEARFMAIVAEIEGC